MKMICQCGCGQEIIRKRHHKYYHPKYIHNHHNRICNPFKGKKHTDETKEKMREAWKHRIVPKTRPKEICEKISKSLVGHYSIFKGKTYEEIFGEEKARQLRIQRRDKILDYNKMLRDKGENHPCWKEGKSFEPYSKDFNKKLKFLVRERDNFTCQLCGKTEDEITFPFNIHHIDYNKKNSSLKNLITLCVVCHSKTLANREFWQEHLLKIAINEVKLCVLQ